MEHSRAGLGRADCIFEHTVTRDYNRLDLEVSCECKLPCVIA